MKEQVYHQPLLEKYAMQGSEGHFSIRGWNVAADLSSLLMNNVQYDSTYDTMAAVPVSIQLLHDVSFSKN